MSDDENQHVYCRVVDWREAGREYLCTGGPELLVADRKGASHFPGGIAGVGQKRFF